MFVVHINTCIFRYVWPISCLHIQPYSVNLAEASGLVADTRIKHSLKLNASNNVVYRPPPHIKKKTKHADEHNLYYIFIL